MTVGLKRDAGSDDVQRCGRADTLYLDAERSANLYNIKCLLVLAGLMIVCDLLNEVGTFIVDPHVMRIGCGLGLIFYLSPVMMMGLSRLAKRRKTPLENTTGFKYFIVLFCYLGTMAICVTLTHHTVLVMAVPVLIAAQYQSVRKLLPLAAVLSTVCVFLGVYGGYFLGYFDANLVGEAFERETAMDLSIRIAKATPVRMNELLTHYALPREIIAIALLVLAASISRRNNEMLKKQASLQSDVERGMRRTNEIQWKIIDGMANLIENRDTDTGEHVKRTSCYVEMISKEMRQHPGLYEDMSEEESATLIKAAPLHDIGKIVVADRILQKPGKLTPEEYNEIKRHASEGEKVIRNVLGKVEDEDFLRVAAEISGCHHERWDGNGYPNGLRGREIPLSARIMAVADVFDALVSKRVYKNPIPPEQAFGIIQQEAGRQFDPQVVKAFCAVRPQILAYLEEGGGEREETALAD